MHADAAQVVNYGDILGRGIVGSLSLLSSASIRGSEMATFKKNKFKTQKKFTAAPPGAAAAPPDETVKVRYAVTRACCVTSYTFSHLCTLTSSLR